MMRDDNCIFCKLANGVIPTNSIYEDEDFKVILDADPVSKGHALILPKQHYANIYEIDDEVAAKIYPLAKKLATKMTEVLGCDGFNVLQNNGEAAGQTVFHLHMHLIPRFKDAPNNKGLIEFTHPGLTEEEIKEICEKLQ
jgi:histidine triad (HIT) family protein